MFAGTKNGGQGSEVILGTRLVHYIPPINMNHVKIDATGAKATVRPQNTNNTGINPVRVKTSSERVSFHPTTKIPNYVNGLGATNALSWKQFFRGKLINKFRIAATVQWTAVVLVGVVFAQKDQGVLSLVWQRATAPEK